MPLFQYKALQANGAVAEGQIEAAGRAEAFRQMETQGLRPVNLTESRNGKAKPAVAVPQLSFGGSHKISARVLENFTRLLSSLLAAGVPLSRALVILHKQTKAPAAAAKWKEVPVARGFPPGLCRHGGSR
jgi:type II secretory pathway component PulF